MPDIDTGAQAASRAEADERPTFRAWYALFALTVTSIFGFLTYQILTLLMPDIKTDLSLTDLQIGETHGLSPAIFSLLILYPIAWVADRYERSVVMGCAVLFWSLATAVSGLAVSFITLQAATVALVMGEAAIKPIVYSLVADLFSPKYRPRANIIVYGSAALGGGLGMVLGGLLIGIVDDVRLLLPASLSDVAAWRLAFFVVALPGPLVALSLFLIGSTRRKGATINVHPRNSVAPIKPYLRKYGLIAFGVFATMGLFDFALKAFASWAPIMLMRIFEVPASEVGIKFGSTFMAASVVGLVTASLLTPFWRKIAGTAYVLRAISVAAAGTAVPVFLLFFVTEILHVYILLFCLVVIFITGVALMPGMMQDIAPAPVRTRIMALGTVVYMLAGGMGSPVVGFVSDQLAADPRGLIWAIVSVSVPAFLACAALAHFMEKPYRRLVATVGAD
ncbi:MFS transporter [Sphingosinicella rhizophila]|uniref:MFS transporter n=1 Tax=Sphingosinicella rhizophila TaxID=3050082 RepID=A0ABU3Q5N1_9SPHN|nr:MFS transporter [Sphingosinicella sp. GR2756]MDT9598716.1 MFS transporter [Sphingosinicella sp. GR2756]